MTTDQQKQQNDSPCECKEVDYFKVSLAVLYSLFVYDVIMRVASDVWSVLVVWFDKLAGI